MRPLLAVHDAQGTQYGRYFRDRLTAVSCRIRILPSLMIPGASLGFIVARHGCGHVQQEIQMLRQIGAGVIRSPEQMHILAETNCWNINARLGLDSH